MAMRWTFMYNQGNGGWTETFYGPETVIQSNAIQISTYTAVLKKSLALRAPGTQIYGFRQTLLGVNPKQSFFQPLNNDYVTPFYTTGNADIKSTDAVIQIYDPTSTLKRPLYIRGLQDNDTVRDPTLTDAPTPGLLNKISAYITAIVGNSWTIQKLDKTPSGLTRPSQVLLISPNVANPNFADLTITPANASLTPGTQVVFNGRQLNDTPGFPRIATVSQVTGGGGTFTIPYRIRASTVTFAPVKMFVKILNYTYPQIYRYVFWHFSEHKTGRPFGMLRGRTRAAVKAQ